MKHLYLLILFTCSSIGLFAQYFPHQTLSRTYDNVGKDEARVLIQTTDQHLLIGGNSVYADTTIPSCSNIWLLKVDTLGDMLWEQDIALSGCEEIRDMTPTADGGAMFVGVTSSLIAHDEEGDENYWGDYFIGKIDAEGTVEWLESYGGSELDQANAIIADVSDTYTIVGGAHSQDGDVATNHGMSDIWTLQIDPSGLPRFSQVWGAAYSEWGTAIDQCRNGDYLVAGFTNSPELANTRTSRYGGGLLIRMDSLGETVWNQNFFSPLGGYFSAVKEAGGGRIALAGTKRSAQTGYDFWWMMLDQYGNLLSTYQPALPNEERFTSMDLCNDGGYILGGYAVSNQAPMPYAKGGDDFWLVRLNARGQVIWRDAFGGGQHERCTDVLAYRPGVYYAVGYVTNPQHLPNGEPDRDFWLVRVEEYPADSIQASIFVRAKDYKINRRTPTRFRAQYKYGDRFWWDFGDETTSTEADPLKSYQLSGYYPITLKVYANETCVQEVHLPKGLAVW